MSADQPQPGESTLTEFYVAVLDQMDEGGMSIQECDAESGRRLDYCIPVVERHLVAARQEIEATESALRLRWERDPG